jgi:hypothetical protein
VQYKTRGKNNRSIVLMPGESRKKVVRRTREIGVGELTSVIRERAPVYSEGESIATTSTSLTMMT